MDETTTKIALITAHKRCGKSFLANKLANEVTACERLCADEVVTRKLLDEFPSVGFVQHTVEHWKQHGMLPAVCQRSRELHGDAFSRLGNRIVADCWLYCIRDIRKSAYLAAEQLARPVEICAVELTPSVDAVIERYVASEAERGERGGFAKLPRTKQEHVARIRLETWNRSFESEDDDETARTDRFERFESSENAFAFLRDWF